MARLESLPAGRGRRGRRPQTRAPRRSFLIVCEGAVTEVLYFEAFRVAKDVRLVVRGEGKSTLSLVEEAVSYAQKAAKDDAPYDEVWVVYDHDDFGADYFNRAADKIRALNDTRGENWNAAWSHESFEVWSYCTSNFSRAGSIAASSTKSSASCSARATARTTPGSTIGSSCARPTH